MFTPSPEYSSLKAYLSTIAQKSKHVGITSCFRGFLKCKFCEEQQYIAGEVVCSPHARLKGEISEKETQTEIKSAIAWDPGPRRTSERVKKKRRISPPSIRCLSDFAIKLAVGNASMFGVCAGCAHELCETEKQEQTGSIVAT